MNKVKNVELFKLKKGENKLSSTNKLWNNERFNSPYLWGYVSQLIGKEDFELREDWLRYYFKSGEERLKIIESLPQKWKDALTTYSTSEPKNTPKWVTDINYYHGRTRSECDELIERMYNQRVSKSNPKITKDEWRHMVFYRVFGETWNGIVAREKNTAVRIQESLDVVLQKIDGKRDYKYAIDYEVYSEKELICALQIKPKSYLYGNSEAIITAKKANKIKNLEYTKETGLPVLYVYSEHNGTVFNSDVLKEINNLMKRKNA